MHVHERKQHTLLTGWSAVFGIELYILLFQQLRFGCGDNNFNHGVSFVFPWHDETHEHIENSEREFYITARACIF